jgi:hypothetical protein
VKPTSRVVLGIHALIGPVQDDTGILIRSIGIHRFRIPVPADAVTRPAADTQHVHVFQVSVREIDVAQTEAGDRARVFGIVRLLDHFDIIGNQLPLEVGLAFRRSPFDREW